MEESSPEGSHQRLLPPGWYRDPRGGRERWWDGAQWTDRYRQSERAAPQQTSKFVRNALVVALAVLLAAVLLLLIAGC